MKIGMADSCGLKFSRDIKEYWEKQGHEVRYEMGASEFISQWADLYYMDWSDNNIHYLYKLYHNQLPDYSNGSTFHKPVFAVRAIDWDVWIGFARSQDIVDFVDKWICLAPHIENKLRSEATYKEGQLKLIRPGVNVDKFPFKTKQTDGFQVGMVLGDMWWYKNHMGGLDIFAALAEKDSRWHLHLRGQHEPGEYNPVMFEYYLNSRHIKDRVTLYPTVEDMNQWYEGIDYLLHPGMKEGFCYAVAEAMAKGIKPIVNDFYGAREIWPSEILYTTHKQALNQFGVGSRIQPLKEYRQFIEEKYSMERMLNEYDKYLGIS